jgi:opacity protein-like surface antigen
MGFKALLGLLLITGWIGNAAAGPYVGLYAAANVLADMKIRPEIVDSTDDFATSFDVGTAVGGIAGYEWSAIRLDVEASYRKNNIQQIVTKDPSGIKTFWGADGKITYWSLMANMWIQRPGHWRPYFGGGLGATIMRLDLNTVEEPGVGKRFIAYDDRTNWITTYQLGAGFQYDLTDHTILGVDYRYMVADKPEFPGPIEDAEALAKSQSVGLSLRYRLFSNLRRQKNPHSARREGAARRPGAPAGAFPARGPYDPYSITLSLNPGMTTSAVAAPGAATR